MKNKKEDRPLLYKLKQTLKHKTIAVLSPFLDTNLSTNELIHTYKRSHPEYSGDAGKAIYAQGEGPKGVEVNGGLITNFSDLCDDSLKDKFHFMLPFYPDQTKNRPPFNHNILRQIMIE